MKLLHTADWHIGRSLYGRKRYDEFESYLNWLAETIENRNIDVLLVAGDIFDNSAPSNRSQELYYRFLCRIANSCCRHVVIIAGNHDSPSFLNAPRQLLKALNVHVTGHAMENLEDEVLVLKDQSGKPELIVCAVPYLRDRDIRTAEAGESIEDKERKLVDGIKQHYANVAELSERKRAELGVEIPIVAMGHLFTAGGQTVDGDGVRELYVGTLAHVTDAIFPAVFNYVALGHLHIPQTVRGSERIRYSGSPIPMGFGEATQKKSLCQVDFQGADGSVEVIEIPCFQRLESIKGDLPIIKNRLLELSADKNSTWIEVIYEGDEVVGDLRDLIEEMVKGNGLEILRIKNNRLMKKTLGDSAIQETLDDLNENEVFERCLIFHKISKDQWPDLLNAYQEILTSVNEVDLNAE